MHVSDPGWYPDPWQQAPMRWWDGAAWTAAVTGPSGQLPPYGQTAAYAGTTPYGMAPAADPVALVSSEAKWGRRHATLVLAMPVVYAVSGLVMAAVFRGFLDAVRSIDTRPGAVNEPFMGGDLLRMQAVSALLSPINLGVLVLRLIWFHQAVAAARALGRRGPREVGLAVAGWIIPIVNFWWPYQDVQALTPEGDPARDGLGLWWACYLLQAFGLFPAVIAGLVEASWPVIVAVVAVGTAPSAVAAVLERRLVHRVIDSHQRAVAMVAAAR